MGFIKAQDVTKYHIANWASQIAFDALIFYVWGWKPLFYFVFCIFLAGGLHPCAGHFISEHYVFPHLDAMQETYSYYGPLNWLTWNVGYHNEHHDFPFVPWSRLPALRRIAHEPTTTSPNATRGSASSMATLCVLRWAPLLG